MKSKVAEIEDLTKNHHVLGFSETWLAPGELIEIKNFDCLDSKTNFRRRSRGRYPGGTSLYVQTELSSNFVRPTLILGSAIGTSWTVLNINNNFKLGICNVYNPPRDSEYANDGFFDELGNQINEIEVKYSCDHIILGGDFNARIGNWQNILNDENREDWELNCQRVCLPQRKSRDSITNANGRDLKYFCTSHDLVVVNGATDEMDDFFTFISGTGGKSTIDLVLCSASLFHRIKSFHVKESILSHHFPVVVEINVPLDQEQETSVDNHSSSIKMNNYKWNKSPEKVETVSKRMSLIQGLFFPAILFFSLSNNIKEALKVFLTLFTSVCHCFLVKCNNNIDIRKQSAPWFNKKCFEAKEKAYRALKQVRKQKNNQSVIHNYLDAKKEYVEIKKKAKTSYWNNKKEEILNICKSADPCKMWKEIKKHTGKYRPSKVDKISSQSWLNYFDTILNKKPVKNPEWDISNQPGNHDDEFERSITENEVFWSLGKIKHGKATGPDRILGDFLKFFRNELVSPLKTLFETIWQSGQYPSEWARSIIVPLHKKGSELLPNNYRGIALLSHIGKVLTRILNKRLVSWIDRNKLISESQAGFRKGYSTLDNIFVLDTIIQDKLQKKNRPLYACFIDIKKCFDWIDRGALFYKLHKKGLPKKMLTLLKDYYNKSEFSVRLNSTERTSYKKSISGVFQGCQMSPQLFSLFINDIVETLDGDENHAPKIEGTRIHCLLYADDIVLLSCSPVGLQRMLNKLARYCQQWQLEVSLEKTKVVVFKKGRKLNRFEKWYYMNQRVEVVPEYTYLGVTFSGSGSWANHISQARSKADRACIALLKFVFKFRFLPVSFFIKIYDSMVTPVLMYGSEIWGGNFLSEKSASAIECTSLKFYKSVLGIPKSAPSSGVLLEFDRLRMKDQLAINITRYWLRISAFPSSRLVSLCLRKQMKMADKGEQCWALKVKNILDCLGLSSYWNRGNTLNKKHALNIIKQKVKDISRVSILAEAREKSSLSDYVLYKDRASPKQKYDTFTTQQRRWLAIIRLNLKRSLPIADKNGALVCNICNSELERRSLAWHHFFMKGCTITKYSSFLETETYTDMLKLSLTNEKYFVEKNNLLFEALSKNSLPRQQERRNQQHDRGQHQQQH